MLKQRIYRSKYRVSFQTKNKIWIYKDSRLRQFFNIRGRKLVRKGYFKRFVVVLNNMKWILARRYFRPWTYTIKSVSETYKSLFYIKQQHRLFYGKSREKTFRIFFRSALKISILRNRSFFSLLESRLDIIFYRLRILPTIFSCQQLIFHRGIVLNSQLIYGSKVYLNVGDTIQVPSFAWSLYYWCQWYKIFFRLYGKFRVFRRYRQFLKKKFFFLRKKSRKKKQKLNLKTALFIKKRCFFFYAFLITKFFHFTKKFWLRTYLIFNFFKKQKIVFQLKFKTILKEVFNNFFNIKKLFFYVLNKNFPVSNKKRAQIVQQKYIKSKNKLPVNKFFFRKVFYTKFFSFNFFFNKVLFFLAERKKKFFLKKILLKYRKIAVLKFLQSLKKKRKKNVKLSSNSVRIIKAVDLSFKKKKKTLYKKKTTVLSNKFFLYPKFKKIDKKRKKKLLYNLSFLLAQTTNLAYFWLYLHLKELFFYKIFFLFLTENKKKILYFSILKLKKENLLKFFFILRRKLFFLFKILLRQNGSLIHLKKQKGKKNVVKIIKKKKKKNWLSRSLLYFVIKRKWVARKKNKTPRLKKIHWYTPTYLYFNFLTLKATLLQFPKSYEILYSFKFSLVKVYSFYKSLGL